MQSALAKAIALIVSADAELLNILSVTAKMSIQSSIIALIIGATTTPVLSRLPMEFLVESKQLIKMALSKD